MGRLLLIRHGETEWNRSGRFQGQQDIPLSRTGCRQAECLHKRLANTQLDSIVSSDLSRAYETAHTISQGHHTQVEVDPRLRETNFGVWEGLTRRDVARQYPDVWSQRQKDWLHTRIPGSELPGDVRDRALACIDEHCAREEGTLAIVSHGGTLRLVVAAMLDAASSQVYRLMFGNASVSALEYVVDHDQPRYVVVSVNDTTHLRGRR